MITLTLRTMFLTNQNQQTNFFVDVHLPQSRGGQKIIWERKEKRNGDKKKIKKYYYLAHPFVERRKFHIMFFIFSFIIPISVLIFCYLSVYCEVVTVQRGLSEIGNESGIGKLNISYDFHQN